MVKKSSQKKKPEKKGTGGKAKPVDGRVKLILGLLLLFLAFFAGLSFVSYLFTWKTDQVFLSSGLLNSLADPGVKVDNWAGKTGVLISNLFIYKWFGLPSLILVFLFAIYGLNLLGLKIFRPLRATKYGLILMIWASVTLGFLMPEEAFQYGGGHGIAISAWLSALMGNPGTLALILATGIGLVILLFRITALNLRSGKRHAQAKAPH